MKKNFTGGLNSLLGQTSATQQVVEPQPEPTQTPFIAETPNTSPVKSTQQGTRVGEARATFIVNESTHEKIKAIAYWDRLQIKEVIDEALSSYVNQYEKQHGAVKPIPARKA